MKLTIHNVEHTVFFIDPAKRYIDGATEGDGSTMENAAFDFPTASNDSLNQTIGNNVVYLIRKSIDGYYAKLPFNRTDSNVESLIILGMPSPDEKYWDQLDEDTQELCKKDTGKACIAKYIDSDVDYSDRSWKLDKCKNFTMANIRFMLRNQPNDDIWWCIDLGSTYGTNVDIRNCEFGAMNEIKDDAGKPTGRTDIYDLTPIENTPGITESEINRSEPKPFPTGSYASYKFINVSSTNWSSIVTLDKVVINHIGYNYGSIYIGKPRNVIINDVLVNNVSGDGLYQTTESYLNKYGIISWGYDEYKAPYVTISNTKVYHYYTETVDACFNVVFGGTVDRILINNVKAKTAIKQTYTPPYKRVSVRPVFDILTRFTGSEIKNVTIDWPNIEGSSGHAIVVNYLNDNTSCPPQKQYTLFKDIVINAWQEGRGFERYVSSERNISNEEADKGNPFLGYYLGLFKVGCISTANRIVSSDFLIQNIEINAPRGIACSISDAILDLTDANIVGCIQFENCVGKINSVSTYYPGYAIKDNGSSLVYIHTVTVNKLNTEYMYNGQPAISVSGKSHLLINTTNAKCWPDKTWTTDYPHSYVCTNDGTAGNYTSRTGYSYCQTWSTKCNASNTGCSLKLTNNEADDWSWPLRIGYDPFRGIVKKVKDCIPNFDADNFTPGMYNAVFYLALYNYNNRFDEIKDRLFIRIKLPDGSFVYSNSGICEQDDSTWEDANGATPYKFTIPVYIGDSNGDIEVDFTWSFYMRDAMTFLDPYPTLFKIVQNPA